MRINLVASALFELTPPKETIMTWETPIVEEIACGMEVTAYAPAFEAQPAESADDLDA